jgi:hypothetical protein
MLQGIEKIDDIGAFVGFNVREELRGHHAGLYLVAVYVVIIVFIERGETALGV